MKTARSDDLVKGNILSCGCLPRFIDMTGQKYGRLLVLSRAPNRGKNVYWLCRCDCGNESTVFGAGLRNGRTQSCGCYQLSRIAEANVKDLIGRTFGRLTVLSCGANVGKHAGWNCICTCGNTTVARGSSLLNGNKQSCGCIQREAASISGKSRAKDIAGEQFGILTAIMPVSDYPGRGRSRNVFWECLCRCGNNKIVSTSALRRGDVISCGCYKDSRKNPLRSVRARLRSRASNHRRKARILNNGGSFTRKQIEALARKQGFRCGCPWCETPSKRFKVSELNVEHHIAVVNGGSNDISNIELWCNPCNLRKGIKDPIVYAQQNGFLL